MYAQPGGPSHGSKAENHDTQLKNRSTWLWVGARLYNWQRPFQKVKFFKLSLRQLFSPHRNFHIFLSFLTNPFKIFPSILLVGFSLLFCIAMEANYFQNLTKLSIRKLLRYYRRMQIVGRKNTHHWKLRNKQDVTQIVYPG